MVPEHSVPVTIGLCPDVHCQAEFHVPDAQPGDRCPMDHGWDDESPTLVIYVRAGARAKRGTKARAECPACGRNVAVRKDGKITRHRPMGAPTDSIEQCPGAGAIAP